MFSNASVSATNDHMASLGKLSSLGGAGNAMMMPTNLGMPNPNPGMPTNLGSNGFGTPDLIKMMLISQLFSGMKKGDGSTGDMIKGALGNALPLIMLGLQDYRKRKNQSMLPPVDPKAPQPLSTPNTVSAPYNTLTGTLMDGNAVPDRMGAVDKIAALGRGGYIS